MRISLFVSTGGEKEVPNNFIPRKGRFFMSSYFCLSGLATYVALGKATDFLLVDTKYPSQIAAALETKMH